MTRAARGYRMPAEWELHQATWVSWPHNEATWPGKLAVVQQAFAQMVALISQSEPVHVNVNDAEMERAAWKMLDEFAPLGPVTFHPFPTNDAWCRDHGAIFVVADRKSPISNSQFPNRALDWQYNAWGGKYPPFDLDNAIPQQMADELGVPCVTVDMVLEGGSIDVNGEGLLLTTESCLLNPNRNPQLDRAAIETKLCDNLGVQKVLWLTGGIAGDDTDGHIDDVSRFVDPRTIVTAVEVDPADENHDPLQANLQRLRTFTDTSGKPLEIATLPMPPAIYHEGTRLPATYANFYIANQIVVMPAYEPETDEQARKILQGLFPSREVVPLRCTDLAWGLGACHCLTQQVPAIDQLS